MTDRERRYLWTEPAAAWGAFVILLATYWSTVAPGVSLWDCPEYVSAAYLLEVGHPPGNPLWMLVERIVTLFVPPSQAALAINLSSGLFTAFAAYFLAKTIFRVAMWVLLKLPRRRIPAPAAAAGGALTGALVFGWCDSVWFSAVEAEVYAMSIFMTSLCLWLMTKWAGTSNRGDSWRLLVLIAYLFGLSIGIHQLNLLCIPALAMIWAVRRGIRAPLPLIGIFLASLAIVACVLTGMMPSTIALAARFELFVVNRLNLPALWGVAIYVALLGLSLLSALYVISRTRRRALMAAACFPAIFLSGIFIFSEHFLAGALVSAAVSAILVAGSNFKARRLYLSMWMLAMMLTGYSAYALIPIRGGVRSPANGAMPDDPFSFAAYQSREQYGETPLLYGPTPMSRPMLHEQIDSTGRASYRYYEINYSSPYYAAKNEGGRLPRMMRGVSARDSAENARLLKRPGDAYIVRGMRGRQVTTPELNMWFPRITGKTPHDLLCYGDWVGMDSSTMVSVAITEAVDSAGNYVTRMESDGRRREARGLRPTYLQNLQWLLTYQTYYMYWRYLMWNFVGRQNDRPSQGEVQHGNFITGIKTVDNAMLGADDKLPPVAGSANKGRNRYFALPLLLGITGIFWLLGARRRGMQTCAVCAVLFVMTGLAITVYLNQGPAEPRERDYSFLGSYLAWSIWIGFGAIAVARMVKSVWGFLVPLAVAGWMCYENYDDHDRSGRHVARNFAVTMLESMDPDAIVFVNGDNYTFPLWYAQEVEGVRRDVRVVNMAYLASPVYAANLLKDWRESKAVPATLTAGDIAWDAFRNVTVPWNSDTVQGVVALRRLRESAEPAFPSRYVFLDDGRGEKFVYDLRNLSPQGSATDFRRLMMFDIVATNAAQPYPRPIYWLDIVGADKRIGLTEKMSPWSFGFRYGLMTEEQTDSALLAETRTFHAPNAPGQEVYMDYTPQSLVATMRASLIYTGRRLLDRGRIIEAAEIADKADIHCGDAPDSYIPVMKQDSAFNVRTELARLLTACGDSLLEMASVEPDPTKAAKIKARALELRARGRYHLKQYRERQNAWKLYREALPSRLRNTVAPVY